MITFLRRFFSACLFLYSIIQAQVVGELSVCALRVSFKQDFTSSTTGYGSFLQTAEYSICGDYTIDPAPHDKDYFLSQLAAVDNYFRDVSYDQFGLDLDNSRIYPSGDTGSYSMTEEMYYYQPYDQVNLHEQKLAELARDAIEAAYSADSIDFSLFDLVVVFHAGIGQDFSLPYLDPTPEDIPSTYVDSSMMMTHIGSYPLGVKHAIILPETQNHLHYQIAEDMFAGSSYPCDYQYGLTGTFALMLGFAVGLPPLWDTNFGESGIGVFGLMDQGSNNGRGLVPAPPDAWTRIYAGWETPAVMKPGTDVSLASRAQNQVVQININDDEYFLVENRTNWFRDSVSIDSVRYQIYADGNNYPPFMEILFDSVNVSRDSNGVVVSVFDYDLGLPASGLLIWHVDESVINSGIADYTINADKTRRGIDLEEADGAQDIGYPSIFLFADPSSGYFGDMWYKGNPEYERANPDMKGQSPEFGPYTFPGSRSNDGSTTFLKIENISDPGDTMTFSISNTMLAAGFPDTSLHIGLIHDFDGDGFKEIIGGIDSIWFFQEEGITTKTHFYNPIGKIYDFSIEKIENSYDRLVINELITVSTLISVFNWNPVDSTFEFLSDTSLIKNEVLYIDSLPTASYNTFTSNLELESFISELFISEKDGSSVNIRGNQFSAGDIDLDGRADIVYRDSLNTLNVFHYYTISSLDPFAFTQTVGLTLLAGFPIQIDSINAQTPLIKNLFGDDHPEIVLQNTNGEILIFDWQGDLEYSLTNYGNLVCLGEYDGKNAIVTESAIWLFDEVSENYGNEWTSKHHDFGNSRTLTLSVPIVSPDDAVLIDRSRTYVFPNPVEGNTATIRVQVETAESVEINIYDLGGYFVEKTEMSYVQQGLPNEYRWDVSDLEPGVYFARVTAKKGNQTEEKVIKIGIIK